MTAKEAIIKAWMDLGVNAPFGICDKTGWSEVENENDVEKILKHHNISIDKIEFEYLEFAGLRYRPKYLHGIENNNQWLVFDGIKNINNLDCWVFTDKKRTLLLETYLKFSSINEFEKITHFQEIKKPLNPIY